MERLRRHPAGLVAGAVAALVSLEAIFLLSAAGLLPFAPFALALAVVDALPGFVSSAVIDALQFWAKLLGEGGVLLFTLVCGALAGVLAEARETRPRVLAVAAIPWALDVLGALASSGRQFDPLGTVVAAVVGVAIFGGALDVARHGAVADGRSRRRAIVGITALVVGLGAGGAFLSSLGRRAVRAAQTLALPRAPVVTAPPFLPEDAAFEATPGLTPQLTTNRDFYVVDNAFFKPNVDLAEWTLTIEGRVDRPYSIGYDELLAMDLVEQVQTLECISNPVGGDLISTAKWTGVRLPDLLARAGVQKEAFDLVMTSVDGYTDSIPLPKALEPTTLVAVGMNGDVLPVEHGFPARMLIPDIYGMKNVKWVTRLRLESYDYRGYWQDRGWSDVAVIVTNARIDTPLGAVRWTGGPVRIAGIAFAGARGIDRVEVSTDQGRTWNVATLGRVVNATTWRRWYFDWTPAGPGEAKLMARAVDGKGVTQVSRPADPYPSGATGYHLVTARIEKA